MTKVDLLHAGAHLMSCEGENPEYDRAILELTAALLGLTSDHYEVVEIALKSLKAHQ